jgi:hypothetical protein
MHFKIVVPLLVPNIKIQKTGAGEIRNVQGRLPASDLDVRMLPEIYLNSVKQNS